MGVNSRDQRRKWEASGEYVPRVVEEWKRKRVPELERLLNKYKDTVYVNNAQVTELKPKVKKVEHFDWKTI